LSTSVLISKSLLKLERLFCKCAVTLRVPRIRAWD
jgi:hypothetical protein